MSMENVRSYHLGFRLPDGKELWLDCPGTITPEELCGLIEEVYPQIRIVWRWQQRTYAISGWAGELTLAQFDPPQGSLLTFVPEELAEPASRIRVQRRRDDDTDRPFVLLYGCPTAALPQREQLEGCRVEVTAL